MDLPAALAKAEEKSILCGNLDPAGVFISGTQQEVAEKTKSLLDSYRQFRGFIPSSACDLPPGVPLNNIEAFYRIVQED